MNKVCAEKCKEELKKRKLSMRQFAPIMNVSFQCISKILKAEGNVSLKVETRICKYLGVDYE